MELDLIQYLNEIGLNNNEAIIYSELLASGPTPISLLAKTSGIKRGTVYNTIESLSEKGLVHHEIAGTKKLIAAQSPDQLGLMVAKQKQLFETVLPRLQALHTTSRPSESLIKQFHGIQSIRSVYSNLLEHLQKNDDYLVIANQEKWYHLDPEFFEKFIQRRAKLSLNIKLLLQDTPHAREFQKKQKKYNETIKILPKYVDLDIAMVITPKQTIIVQIIQPVFALVIENISLVEMNKILFDLLWGVLEKSG